MYNIASLRSCGIWMPQPFPFCSDILNTDQIKFDNSQDSTRSFTAHAETTNAGGGSSDETLQDDSSPE